MGVWTRRCCCGPGCLGSNAVDGIDCTGNTCPDDMIPYWPPAITFRFTNWFSHGWGVTLNGALTYPHPRCAPDFTGPYSCGPGGGGGSGYSWQLGLPEQADNAQTCVMYSQEPPVPPELPCIGTRHYGGIHQIVYPNEIFPSFEDNSWGVPAETFGSSTDYWLGGRDWSQWRDTLDAPKPWYQLVGATLIYTGSVVDGVKVSTAILKISMRGTTIDPNETILYGSATNPDVVYIGHGDTTGNTGCYCGSPTAAVAALAIDVVESSYGSPTSPTTPTGRVRFNSFEDAPDPPGGSGPCDWCAEGDTHSGPSCTEECDELTIGAGYFGNNWNYWSSSPGVQYQYFGMFFPPWDPTSCTQWAGTGQRTTFRVAPNEGYASCDDAAIYQMAHWATPTPARDLPPGNPGGNVLTDMSIVI